MSLQSEIISGLDVPNWNQSIAAVKRTVANALQALDRGIDIKDTQYFNHSFVPDFILSWPRDPGRQRDVFLRLDSSAAFLNRDLDLLGNQAPVLLSLAPEWGAAQADELPVQREVKPATLFTEPNAVEHLVEASKSTDFGQVVPAAVLKGGKGWIDESVASAVSAAASDFFSGASSHEADIVGQAAPLLAEHLDAVQAGRVLNLGRVVWEATGGEPTEFPVRTDLSGLDDTALRFLLDEGPSENLTFWRSIGRLIGLERLLNVGVRGGPNLAALVRANADRLLARALVVKQTQQALDDAGPEWAVEAGALTFRGSDFVAYLAAHRDDLAVNADELRALGLAAFRSRTADEQVETVTVVAGDGKKVTIESEDMFDPSTDAVLASVGDLPGTTVEAVGLLVSGKRMNCDFTTRSASGHTNAQFAIVDLVKRALPMLHPLTDPRDAAEIKLLLVSVARASGQMTLFDDPAGVEDMVY